MNYKTRVCGKDSISFCHKIYILLENPGKFRSASKYTNWDQHVYAIDKDSYIQISISNNIVKLRANLFFAQFQPNWFLRRMLLCWFYRGANQICHSVDGWLLESTLTVHLSDKEAVSVMWIQILSPFLEGKNQIQFVKLKQQIFYSILGEFLSHIFTPNFMISGIKSFLFVPRQIRNILNLAHSIFRRFM